MSPPTSPLKARDVNTSVPSPSKQASEVAAEDQKPKSMEYHRQILQSRLEEDKYELCTYTSSTLPPPSFPPAFLSPIRNSADESRADRGEFELNQR